MNGPFSIRKQDGGELLKTEVIFENSEREIFRMNAWGSSLAFMVQRLAKLNAVRVQLLEYNFIYLFSWCAQRT